MQNLTVRGSSNSNSNVICSCNCTGSQPQGMDISELEFVQIIIIIVVMTVMIVVIVCLLNHYKLSSWSLITRHSQSRRQEEALRPMMYGARSRERFTAPSFMQRDRFGRFQPTYPYLQHQIDLPPTIALSDGEEPPPYLGPCKLQLRDPEQQMELNRESVRAPPNRTVYDSELAGGPRPPSCNSGVSATNSGGRGPAEGPPPAYSEVAGRHPGSSSSSSSSSLHQHSNNAPSAQRPGSRTVPQGRSESTIVLIKAKEGRRDKLV
ncbi:low-density lipoprotein receptor class A domain-containing protein 4-like isoform X2 [Conger conger]|uniref:low-density lipoprotein receptor class A domain-containing protein 4-like isoform X2 n=1 Tax=Conger conger TaxID=82655 RepID=UPI002A5B1058|nr:low-density lipoprotein receptor class A domain-containing protein 4-like isoform X2 [Conger conger]